MAEATVGPTNGHFVAMEVLQVAITGRGSNAVSAARARFWRFGPATWLAGCTASYRGASGSVRCRRAVRRYPRLWFSGALFWVFSRQIAQQRGLTRDGATESGLKDARIYVSELAYSDFFNLLALTFAMRPPQHICEVCIFLSSRLLLALLYSLQVITLI